MTKPTSPSSSAKPAKHGQTRKSAKERRERQRALEKLRVMVGGDENSSQLEVMQNVIDYIAYLQAQLTDDLENLPPNPADQLVRQLSGRLQSVLAP